MALTTGTQPTLPAATGKRVPVVLIVSGAPARPTDSADGNSPRLGIKTDAYRQGKACRRAVRAGIASVRYDKRLPQTAEGEAALRFDNYVDDGKRWVEKLNSDPRFSGVTLAGHSEGSLIGILTAQRTKMHAYVSLEGAGRPAGSVILREQLSRGNPGGTGRILQIEQILQQLEAGDTVAHTPAALAALFRPSARVQPRAPHFAAQGPADNTRQRDCPKLNRLPSPSYGDPTSKRCVPTTTPLPPRAPKSRKVVVDGMNHVLKHVLGYVHARRHHEKAYTGTARCRSLSWGGGRRGERGHCISRFTAGIKSGRPSNLPVRDLRPTPNPSQEEHFSEDCELPANSQ